MAQRLKCLPAMWETWVWSLGQEDPLEKEIATHSSILAWRSPRMEEPGGLQSMGLQRVRHDWVKGFLWSTCDPGDNTVESFWTGETHGCGQCSLFARISFPSLFPVLSSLFSALLFVLTGSYQLSLSSLWSFLVWGNKVFSSNLFNSGVIFFLYLFLCVCVCVCVCFSVLFPLIF